MPKFTIRGVLVSLSAVSIYFYLYNKKKESFFQDNQEINQEINQKLKQKLNQNLNQKDEINVENNKNHDTFYTLNTQQTHENESQFLSQKSNIEPLRKNLHSHPKYWFRDEEGNMKRPKFL